MPSTSALDAERARARVAESETARLDRECRKLRKQLAAADRKIAALDRRQLEWAATAAKRKQVLEEHLRQAMHMVSVADATVEAQRKDAFETIAAIKAKYEASGNGNGNGNNSGGEAGSVHRLPQGVPHRNVYGLGITDHQLIAHWRGTAAANARRAQKDGWHVLNELEVEHVRAWLAWNTIQTAARNRKAGIQ